MIILNHVAMSIFRIASFLPSEFTRSSNFTYVFIFIFYSFFSWGKWIERTISFSILGFTCEIGMCAVARAHLLCIHFQKLMAKYKFPFKTVLRIQLEHSMFIVNIIPHRFLPVSVVSHSIYFLGNTVSSTRTFSIPHSLSFLLVALVSFLSTEFSLLNSYSHW